MKFSLVKKTITILIISTVFIAGLSTVYAGNVFNENQEFVKVNKINNFIQSNLLSKEKCKIFDFLFRLISKTIGLTVYSVGLVLSIIVGFVGFSIHKSISEDMLLLKVLIGGLTGGIVGSILGITSIFAEKRLGMIGDIFVDLTQFIVFIFIALMPFYLDYLPI